MSSQHRGCKEQVEQIDVVDDVASAFQPFYADRLTREDAEEITSNLARYFDLLARWQRGSQAAEACSTASPSFFSSDTTEPAPCSVPVSERIRT